MTSKNYGHPGTLLRAPRFTRAKKCARLIRLGGRCFEGLVMQQRRVFVETAKGRISAYFSVPFSADPADVSMLLRDRGWAPYRLRLDQTDNCWVAVVIDWKRAA